MPSTNYHKTELLCKGSPVHILVAHCEAWGKDRHKLMVHYLNLSPKTISEATFCALGSETGDGTCHPLQLKLKKSNHGVASNGGSGSFYELDKVARVERVFYSRVTFEDGTVWELPEGSSWEHVPKQSLLFTHLGRELYKQYQRDVMGIWAWFLPEDYEGLRRCACGGSNSVHALCCRKCGTKLDYVFFSLDPERLKENYERYTEAREAAEKRERAAIKNRYEDVQFVMDEPDTDPLEQERELRRMISMVHSEGERLGFTCYPDRNYSFMRKKEETDEDLRKKGCKPPDEQYSFWRLPESKDTYLLDEGYRPPDESHNRWYWPENRIR